MKTILINCSNLSVGGGLQVAVSFLNELYQFKPLHLNLVFVVSKEVNKQIPIDFSDFFELHVVKSSPASMIHGYKAVRQLTEIERGLKPDIVFTVFGPAYWKPKCTHLVGFASPWIINPTTTAYKLFPFWKRLFRRMKYLYYKFRFKYESDYFVVEAEHVKKKLAKICAVDSNRIFVISNTYSSFYSNPDVKRIDISARLSKGFNLLTISHNYPHKNLSIIEPVYNLLKERGFEVKFFITFPLVAYERMPAGFKEATVNIGPVPSNVCPSLYYQTDGLFLPTLLECFSASYPEAMAMGKPILTSDLDFARDLCKDTALYFNPHDPSDIANKIISIIENQSLRETLVSNGFALVKKIPSAKERAFKYLQLCESI